jgi:hypothetical protein
MMPFTLVFPASFVRRIGALAVGAATCGALSSCGLCGNQPVAEYPSPDGKAKVVVFERDCGATTDFTTQASLLPVSAGLPSGVGNLLVIDSNHAGAPAGPRGGPELRVRWINGSTVEVSHYADARVFKSERSFAGVNATYVTFR